jgi:hypothetical protein
MISLFWALVAAVPDDAEAQLRLVPTSADIPASLSPGWARQVTPAHPTSQWQPDDKYRDNWLLTLPSSQPKGTYNLQLAVNGIEQTIGQVIVGGRERRFAPSPIANPVSAAVGDSIRLLGFETTQNEDSLNVTLVWQAIETPPEDYTVFVQLLDAQNQIIAQNDSPPQNGDALTSSWAAGEVVVDEHTLLPAPGITSGSYRLITGMYHPSDGRRLTIVSNGQQADALLLGEISTR